VEEKQKVLQSPMLNPKKQTTLRSSQLSLRRGVKIKGLNRQGSQDYTLQSAFQSPQIGKKGLSHGMS